MKKNILLTLCFSVVPGCGQMYQGYMKRGISLMFWFCGILMAAIVLRLEILLILLPIVWAYSFFDTFNLRNLSPEQHAAMGDFFLPGNLWVENAGKVKWVQNASFNKLAGWGMVGLGALVLYNLFWDVLFSFVWSRFPQIAVWVERVPGLLIAVLVIMLGLHLLRAETRKKEELAAAKEEELTEYKGGATDA